MYNVRCVAYSDRYPAYHIKCLINEMIYVINGILNIVLYINYIALAVDSFLGWKAIIIYYSVPIHACKQAFERLQWPPAPFHSQGKATKHQAQIARPAQGAASRQRE